MVKVGTKHILPVVKSSDFGVYLDAGELGEVLLPRKYVPRGGLRAGDSVDVFLYLDSEDRPVATTQTPLAQVGEFAFLRVVDISHVGAFLDWGLAKDILAPFAEQHRPMEVGHSYLVYLYIDRVHGRITASSKIDKFLKDDRPHDFKAGQAVKLIIANSTELGYKTIVNHSHWGVLHKSDVFQRLSFGQSISGFIKHVRPDGKIDVSLQGGRQTREKYAALIEDYLKSVGGFAPVHDKSSPEEIARLFGMSKGSFKKTIGTLYKQKIITIDNEGIRLTALPGTF